MNDLLERADRPPPGRHARRRHRLAGVLVVLALLIVVGATGAYAVGRVYTHFAPPPDYTGSGVGTVVVQVRPGDTAYDIAVVLVQRGVVKSEAAFRKAAAADPRSTSLQPGFYQLHEHMSAAAALGLLLSPAARILGKVTVPEGSTVNQTLALVAKGTHIPLADLQRVAAHPSGLGLPSYAGGHLEGFLFPATYDIPPDTSATTALAMMVSRFREAAAADGLVTGAAALHRSPYDVLIVASLIERESRLPSEYPKVARVVYNRLDKKMTLGIDATVLYGLGRTSGSLSESDLARNTPYNTRLHPGLPPTPISSPGDVALQAALHPAAGNWLYYVLADKSGRQLFTSDYQAFLRQKALSHAEGLL